MGSYQGHSAVTIASVLDFLELYDVPLLCIDPWTGDLNTWANREKDPALKVWASPVEDGRTLLFDQFMANVQFAVSRSVSDRHILPFHATSTVGARFLKAMEWHPDIIFLDSSHEIHETLQEIRFYYDILRPGGILFGDDYNWPGVYNDVQVFVAENGDGPQPINGNIGFNFYVMRADPTNPHSIFMWVIHKWKI